MREFNRNMDKGFEDKNNRYDASSGYGNGSRVNNMSKAPNTKVARIAVLVEAITSLVEVVPDVVVSHKVEIKGCFDKILKAIDYEAEHILREQTAKNRPYTER